MSRHNGFLCPYNHTAADITTASFVRSPASGFCGVSFGGTGSSMYRLSNSQFCRPKTYSFCLLVLLALRAETTFLRHVLCFWPAIRWCSRYLGSASAVLSWDIHSMVTQLILYSSVLRQPLAGDPTLLLAF